MVLAEELVGDVAEAGKFTPKVVADLERRRSRRPGRRASAARARATTSTCRCCAGDYVTADAGTGFVHTAPGHGADDYELGVANGVRGARHGGRGRRLLSARAAVRGPEGLDTGGQEGRRPTASVIEALTRRASCWPRGRITHTYPHSWRSKAPVIFRNTPQWFIAMDKPIAEIGGTLREKALAAIDATRFVPRAGYNRMRSMVESRPDWCSSRQRAWGVPIAMFVDKETGEPLRDPEVIGAHRRGLRGRGRRRLVRRARPSASSATTTRPRTSSRCATSSTSGSTPARRTPSRSRAARTCSWPADLYLEGSDQHRGWFQSSLLESLRHARPRALRRRADARLHARRAGPQDVEVAGQRHRAADGDATSTAPTSCACGWSATDYTEDQRIGTTILQHQADAYRRLRNTLRFLLGNLAGSRRRRRSSSRRAAGAGALGAASPGRARRDVPAGGRGLRLPHDRDRAAQFLRGRPLGLLLRHPQGRALLRRAQGAAPARRAHGDGRAVLVPHRLARADHLLHRRRGVADAAQRRAGRRGRERASARSIPAIPNSLARRGAGREVEDRARRCAASSPARWSWSAPRSASARACRRRRTSMSRRSTWRR